MVDDATTLSDRVLRLTRVTHQPLASRVVNLISAADLARRVVQVITPVDYAQHDLAREAARRIYEQAAVHAALLAKQKKKMTEAAVLLLLLMAGEDAYERTLEIMGNPATLPAATLKAQGAAFAEARQSVLKEFAAKVADTVAKAQADAAERGLDVADSVRATRSAVREASKVMAATESQITYGTVQLDRLARAGFKTVAWVDMDDDKVRPTHRECSEQGPVKIGQPFVNGLRYPGDPAGPASEVCNCRCYLIGVSR